MPCQQAAHKNGSPGFANRNGPNTNEVGGLLHFRPLESASNNRLGSVAAEQWQDSSQFFAILLIVIPKHIRE